MKQPTGNEIVKLLGLSESDDKILDLFDSLVVDKNEFNRDEIDGDFFVDLEDKIGLVLVFEDSLPEHYRSPTHSGGQYLVQIVMDYNFEPLPYGLTDDDNLEIVEKKIGKKANYVSIDDAGDLYWMYEELGWIKILFEDETYSSIHSMQIRLYENPEDENLEDDNGFDQIMKPFKR